MSKRHHFFLLDHMVVGLKPEFREDITETTLERGLTPDADDMDVIDLAYKRHAILVTVDVEIPQKCKTYQDQYKSCLYGLLMLPDGIEIQRRLLSDLRQGTKRMRHVRYDRPLGWANIHRENLMVKLHREGEPSVEELCDCPWDED